jgi:ACS family D-galactonate transporter-like MFS transporter
MATVVKPALKDSSKILWLLLSLLVVSIFVNYIDRSNLSVAATDLSRELSLNSSDLGLLLGAFFWTYAAFQIVAGWVVDRYNVYVAYGIAFFLWSAATALTGFAGSLAVLFALRLVLGFGESIAYPAYSKIIARDFPARHRGLANALIDAGSKAGPALGTLIGGLIVANFGWRSLFFILGFGAMIWLIPWFALIPREKRAASLPASPAPHAAGPGFLEIASKRDAWGTFLVLFCGNYAWYFFLTWLPPYLEMERHFSKTMMAIYGSIPFTGIALSSIFGGWLSDRLIHRGASPTLVRKGFAITGLLMMTLVLPASMLPNQVASMALLTAGCLCYGLYSSNVWAITQTLAGPSAAGKWTGMQNCIGNISGVVAPWLTGFLVQQTGQFFLAFVAVAIALVLGACSYIFLVGKVAPIAWRASAGAASGGTAVAPE